VWTVFFFNVFNAKQMEGGQAPPAFTVIVEAILHDTFEKSIVDRRFPIDIRACSRNLSGKMFL
jgi:hypothetical protein